MNKSGVYAMKLYVSTPLRGARRLDTFHVFTMMTSVDRNNMREIYRIIRNSGLSAFKSRRMLLELATMGHYSETHYRGSKEFNYGSVN